MSKIKLFVSDMDGSFLDSLGRVSKVNFRALNLLKKNGVKICLSTGRNIELIRPYLREYCDYLITNNGAIIYKKIDNDWKIIFSKTLNSSMVFKYLKSVMPVCYGVQILYEDEIFSTPDNNTLEFINRANKLIKNGEDIEKSNALFHKFMKLIDDPIKLVKSHKKDITKLDIFYDVQNTGKFNEITSKFCELNPILCFDGDVEIVATDIDKGFGVLKVCENMNIKPDEVVSFGDSGNDLKMKEVGTTFIAVKNALDFVRKDAYKVCGSNDKSGIGRYIIRNLRKL